MGNYAYLVCVQASDLETGDTKNNNKFYEMKESNDGTFIVNFGRIGSTSQTTSYPMSKWHSIYNQKTGKIRNGYIYKDITSLKSTSVSSSFKDITNPHINKLIQTLQKYSKQSIIDNYTVTSEQVTQAQIDKAQEIVDRIANRLKVNNIVNSIIDNDLMELYTIIPRKMKKVQDHLLNGTGDKNKARLILQNEQDTLDVMRGQVGLNSVENKADKTITQALGIVIDIEEDKVVIDKIKSMMNGDDNQLRNVYKVQHTTTEPNFIMQKTKSIKQWTKLLWHGSGNENWLNILKTGLKIRPSCAVQTGAMFGNGIYYADKYQKSRGYTSLSGSYWRQGNSKQAFIAIFEVNTGMELRIERDNSKFRSFDYSKLRQEGEYDSLFVKGGYDLRNNEFIVYKESQCTIKYLVEIGE